MDKQDEDTLVQPHCIACNATSKRFLRTGPDGGRTLCDKCSQRYRNHRLRLFQARDGTVSARWHPGSIAVVSTGFDYDIFNKRVPDRPIVRPATPGEHQELSILRRPGRPPKSSKLPKREEEPASGSSSQEILQVPPTSPTPPDSTEPPLKKEDYFFVARGAHVPHPPTRNLPGRAAKVLATARNASLLSTPSTEELDKSPAPPMHIARPRIVPLEQPQEEEPTYLGKRKRDSSLPHILPLRYESGRGRTTADLDVKTEDTEESGSDAVTHSDRPFAAVAAGPALENRPIFRRKVFMIKVELQRIEDTQSCCVRVLAIPSGYSWSALKAHLSRAFSVTQPFITTYRDGHGEIVRLSSDLDLPGLFHAASQVEQLRLRIMEQ